MRKLQVLGTGCPTCEKLAGMVSAAATELELDFELEKVTEIEEIMAFGVAATPALVVNGEVKLAGGLPTEAELRAMLA